MELAAFDYDLPDDRIAQHPVEPRDAARLLVDQGPGRAPLDRHVRDLPAFVVPGDLLVVNETRVLPARLHLRKPTGGAVEVLLLEPVTAGAPAVAGGPDLVWEALVRPSRKVPPGTVLAPADPDRASGPAAGLAVEVGEDRGEGRRLVRLVGLTGSTTEHRRDGLDGHLHPRHDGSADEPAGDPLLDALGRVGEVPLPPYITAPLEDRERYQTVYARRAASAAAPTAGLHFTTDLLDRLGAAGVATATVELVVGLGTFRPITAEVVEDHRMHTEAYQVPEATWAAVAETRARGGRVVAVGTTAVRALESAAATGELAGRTELFIHGEHRFAVVDRLLTNFHQPRSSLLVLIDAFVGPRWRDLYAAALAGPYRFLSFGDAMLLTRRDLDPPEARP